LTEREKCGGTALSSAITPRRRRETQAHLRKATLVSHAERRLKRLLQA